MKHVNDVKKGIKTKMCINMQEMDKKWNEDLEMGKEIQSKAIRKGNE